MSRTLAKSPDLWGWDAEQTTVETDTPVTLGPYTVVPVYVNDRLVGDLVGLDGWYGYLTGDAALDLVNCTAVVKGNRGRQHALVALVEATSR